MQFKCFNLLHTFSCTIIWVLFSNTWPFSEGGSPVPILLFSVLEPKQNSWPYSKTICLKHVELVFLAYSNRHFKTLQFLPKSKYNKRNFRWLSGKESTCQYKRGRRHGFDPWVGNIPQKRKWQPTSIFLPGKSHGQRNLAGYIP